MLAAVLSVARAEAAAPCTAFVDVSVVAVDREAIAPRQTVVVQGAHILSVGRAHDSAPPAGCRRIDGRGRYLIPGLVDTHAHFFGLRTPEVAELPYEQQVLSMFLANGITTTLVMEGTPELLKLRDAVAAGGVLGPNLYVAGALIQMDGDGLPPGRRIFPTTAAVRDEILAEKRAGYDFVKVHGDMTPEGYATLLRTAREQGLRVIGHAPPNLGIDATLDGGQVMIAHAESYLDAYFRFNRPLPTDPGEIDRMAAEVAAKTARRGIWVQPTLAVFRQIGDQVADFEAVRTRPPMQYMPKAALAGWFPPEDPYLNRWTLVDIAKLRAQYAIFERLTKALDAAGVRLLAGTDDMTPDVLPGFALKDELEQMVGAGLTPARVLQTATLNPALFLGDKTRGLIGPGKTADLVLLNANPLDDIDNVFRQEGVMVRGRWLTEDTLMRTLKAGAPHRPAREPGR